MRVQIIVLSYMKLIIIILLSCIVCTSHSSEVLLNTTWVWYNSTEILKHCTFPNNICLKNVESRQGLVKLENVQALSCWNVYYRKGRGRLYQIGIKPLFTRWGHCLKHQSNLSLFSCSKSCVSGTYWRVQTHRSPPEWGHLPSLICDSESTQSYDRDRLKC